MKTQMQLSRRQVIRSLMASSLILPALSSVLFPETKAPAGPPPPKKPPSPPKASRVIFLFSTGGVSHMDTFDYKPQLFKADGKMLGAGGGLSLEKKPLV